MLINDTPALERNIQGKLIDKATEDIQKGFQDYFKNCPYIGDPVKDPTNLLIRMGKPLKYQDLEKKLKKLNPSLTFKHHPTNTSLRICYFKDGHVCYDKGYEPGAPMAQQSTLARLYEDTYDPSYIRGIGKNIIQRADLPDLVETSEGVFGFAPGAKIPGTIRKEQPGREVNRGWQTVLILLMLRGQLDLAATERAFDIAFTAEWKGHTGKGAVTTPW